MKLMKTEEGGQVALRYHNTDYSWCDKRCGISKGSHNHKGGYSGPFECWKGTYIYLGKG